MKGLQCFCSSKISRHVLAAVNADYSHGGIEGKWIGQNRKRKRIYRMRGWKRRLRLSNPAPLIASKAIEDGSGTSWLTSAANAGSLDSTIARS
jgi:hypothetical protein